MVFPSVPLYLDPPTWNQEQAAQHQHHQQQQHLQPVPTQPPPDGNTGGAPPSSSIRPNSMADRARLAKIPQPEQALKCPRCDSTNTKFCYFNNYSLSQPRHFCKTCRRYWTCGGALRNVPVGGGCRRNKRSKNTSKTASSASTADRQAGASSSSTATSAGAASLAAPQSQLPAFMASLQPMMVEYGGGGLPNLGLGFSGMQAMDHSAGVDYNQIQLQQFPFLGGLETQLPTMSVSGMYHFDGAPTGSELASQMASVKMEDSNSRGLNLGRHHFANLGAGINSRNDQFWVGGGANNGGEGSTAAAAGDGGWMANLSGFNSSSTGSIL